MTQTPAPTTEATISEDRLVEIAVWAKAYEGVSSHVTIKIGDVRGLLSLITQQAAENAGLKAGWDKSDAFSAGVLGQLSEANAQIRELRMQMLSDEGQHREALARAVASESREAALLEKVRVMGEALEIERAPRCFACGAKITEACRRPPDKACGREHHGGTRAARVCRETQEAGGC